MTALASHNCGVFYSNCSGGRALATVLRASLPVPFSFFKRWRLYDFHTSRWTRANPSAHIKRTLLGRSCIDQPTMDMVSVSRYGGYAQRELLVTLFRKYRSVDRSTEVLKAGQEAVRTIKFSDFAFDAEGERDLAAEFACLYLNASLLFGVVPPDDMLTQLIEELASLPRNLFVWECFLCALVAFLRHSATATAVASAFAAALRAAAEGSASEAAFSKDAATLFLLVVGPAVDALLQGSAAAEDGELLLHAQQEAIGVLCASASLTPAELRVLTHAVCWCHAAGGRLSALTASVVLRPLLAEVPAALAESSVLQCTRRFCALCLLLASEETGTSKEACERHSNALDLIVRHLDQRVRMHSVDDVICVLIGLQANSMARARYKKYPCALLDHLKEELACSENEGDRQVNQTGRRQGGELPAFFNDTSDSLRVLTDVLSQLVGGAEDELAEAAENALMDVFLPRSL